MVVYYKLILLFIFEIKSINSNDIFSKEKCLKEPLLKNLEISTTLIENSNNYNIIIFSGCEISENWKVKYKEIPLCVNKKRVFEAEENLRRPIRFFFKPNHLIDKNEKLQIKSISLSYDNNIAETILSKDSFSLYQNDYIDIYIQYECLSTTNNWFKIILTVNIENSKIPINFEYYKICQRDFLGNFDLSHFIIMVFVFGIIYFSFNLKLNSIIEDIVILEFHEMRNPENLTIISIILIMVLSGMYFINFLSNWIILCLIIIIPLSTEMIIEPLHKGSDVEKTLSNKYLIIPYLGELTYEFVLCFIIGIILMIIWFLTHNWLVNDIIAIFISIVSIRIFKFTNSKFIISFFILSLVYEIIWTINYSKIQDKSKLTNNTKNLVPLRLLCPELISSPLNRCTSVPISDIILPGIFLAYSKIFDEYKKMKNKTNFTYFNIGLISLGIGLVLNLCVYHLYSRPTPTFLFTGTIMLFSTLYNCYSNGHFDDYIFGFKSTEFRISFDKEKDNVNNVQNNNGIIDFNNINNDINSNLTFKKTNIEMKDYS